MVFCIDCGEKMQRQAAFCFACGAKKFSKNEAPVTAAVEKVKIETEVEKPEPVEGGPKSQVESAIEANRTNTPSPETAAAQPKSKRRLYFKIFAALIIVPLLLFLSFLALSLLNGQSNTPPEVLVIKPAKATVQTSFNIEKNRLDELIKTHEDLLIRQEVEFELAQESRRITDLGKFVEKYPESPYHAKAWDLAASYLDEQGSLLAFRTFVKYFGNPGNDYTGIREFISDDLTIIGQYNENGFFGNVKWISPHGEIEGKSTGGYLPDGPVVIKYNNGNIVKGILDGKFKLVGDYTCKKPNGDICRIRESHQLRSKD